MTSEGRNIQYNKSVQVLERVIIKVTYPSYISIYPYVFVGIKRTLQQQNPNSLLFNGSDHSIYSSSSGNFQISFYIIIITGAKCAIFRMKM